VSFGIFVSRKYLEAVSLGFKASPKVYASKAFDILLLLIFYCSRAYYILHSLGETQSVRQRPNRCEHFGLFVSR
jgi:hypothetical protein